MSSIAQRVERDTTRGVLAVVLATLRFIWASWHQLSKQQWALAAVIALAVIAFGAITTIEQSMKMDWPTTIVIYVLHPVLATLTFFLAWAVADAGSDTYLQRHLRMLIALIAATTLSAMGAHEMVRVVGYFESIDRFFSSMERTPPAHTLLLAVDMLNSLILGGLIIAVVEANRHRLRTQHAIDETSREQTVLARHLLESRLSAMQAQVEPQFLFDSLIDVQTLYNLDPLRGADVLDRLIAYLRVALPRLRESGSTVATEINLVRTYLNVLTARNSGQLSVLIRVEPGLENTRFYPMLILPLVQRLAHSRRERISQSPQHIDLVVASNAPSSPTMTVTLRCNTRGLCADDDDLARVRERLATLTGGLGELRCEELESGTAQFTLHLPSAAAAPSSDSSDTPVPP